jgi:sugar phosphate isomerase/epimerase
MFESWKQSRDSIDNLRREELIELAKQYGIQVYEVETYRHWSVKLVLPGGSSTSFPAHSKRSGYQMAIEFIKEWKWKDKETRIV